MKCSITLGPCALDEIGYKLVAEMDCGAIVIKNREGSAAALEGRVVKVLDAAQGLIALVPAVAAAPAVDAASKGLEVGLVGDRLVISIPIDTLVFAAEHAFETAYGEEHGLKVTDSKIFAEDVLRALQYEKEDGTTPVHELLDAALISAVDDGSEGVEENEADDDDE